jgi:uncharacterized membrane protein
MTDKKVQEAQVVEDNTKTAGQSNDINTGMAIVAYILFFIPLLTEYKDNTFVKFHVKQSLILTIAGVIVSWLAWIPFFGWILGVGVFILWVMGVMNAANGEQKELPYIGKYADEWFKF